MDLEKSVYPLSRYWYNGGFRFYYAYGNTPPQDFLQNCKSEKNPSILVLGCGDIRSCFYSLWKNFDMNGPVRFDGVHFTLNDNSAAVLARNILFLYLCLQMPTGDKDVKKWLSSMWAIWYCHELYPEHNQMLHDSLRTLCKYSSDWTGKSNLLYPMVKFSSVGTFNEVHRMWKMWLEHDVDVSSVKKMHSARQDEFLIRGWSLQYNDGAAGFVEDSTEIPFEIGHNARRVDQGKTEVLSYMKSGSVYAEKVLGLQLPPNKKTSINFTLYEREDGKYNLHYRSLPFSCYFHSVEFSPEHNAKSTSKLYVENPYFRKSPFLANSVQQFSLWLQSCRRVLTSKRHANIFFTVNCSHALNFCFELEGAENPTFDLIYTSNLMDHLSPPNLILSAIPLLKDSGLLFTATLYKQAFKTIEKCLTTTFGFSCKLFPVILGIRCINYEGGNYASPVTAYPRPITMKRTRFVYHEEVLIWEKLSGRLPLVFSPGQQLSDVLTRALHSSAVTSVYTVLKPTLVPQMTTNLCVETAIKVIQVFMRNVCADFTPQFWQPLSDSVRHAIKPYLHCMQTQLFLHNIHMHLSMGTEDCPFCLQVPLSKHIGLFTTRLFLQPNYTPKYMALIHKELHDDAEYLCDIARKGGNVFVFDCISPISNPDNFLELYFYAPLKLVQKNYRVTIVSSVMGTNQITSTTVSVSSNVPSSPTKLLCDLQITFTEFQFFKAPSVANVQGHILPLFGAIFSHVSDGDSSEVEIDLLHSVIPTQSDKNLKTERVSSSALKLSLGNSTCILQHLFPISYGGVKIKLMKKSNKLILYSPRALQPFEDEKPVFIVNTEKEFSLFPLVLTSEVAIESLSGQQFTAQERETMETCIDSILPPLIQVKKSLLHFFQTKHTFYNLVHPEKNVVGLVLINNRLFDYESRTPVIELAFCFLEESFVHIVAPLWTTIIMEQNQLVYNIHVDDSMFTQMKEVFCYYANRTHGTCAFLSDSECPLSLLSQKGIQEYFVRAAIFLLLCDSDLYTQMIEDKIQKEIVSTTKANTKQCDNCGSDFHSTKSCSGCKKAIYCSKKCQREHWTVHKLVCDKKNDGQEMTNKQPFPLARYWYGGDFKFYYAIGNTPAKDLLESYAGIDIPEVLILGCGDIRSCFYTLWKNFDSRPPKPMLQGAHFLLNDCSSSILARNILFLHLCLVLPAGEYERKKWLSAMWAIWYCHELYPQHQMILNDSLKILLEHSQSLDQWKHSSNPLCKLVKFSSSVVLTEISAVWRKWYMPNKTILVNQMQLSRHDELKRHGVIDILDAYASSIAHMQTFIGGHDPTTKKIKARVSEVKAYTQNGNCYAEKVLDLDLPVTSTSVNLTLYERSDGGYTLHYGSLPFNGYYHTVIFSPDGLSSAGVEKRVCDTLLVKSCHFSTLPCLANSVQQFTMWIQSSSILLKSPEKIKVCFTFNNEDAVSLCHVLESTSSKYDLIYTSNLMDHLGPPNVILPAIPVLNPDGLLFTTTLIYKTFVNTAEEYLQLCFGFDCKYLPVILGIRCINMEGSNYANPVMIEPTPVDICHMLQSMQQSRSLVWRKVTAPLFVIPRLPQLELDNITRALLNSVKVSAFTLLNTSGKSQAVLNNICIETAVHILQTFMSNILEADNSYHFWDSLSTALCSEIKPFIHGLQTRLLLHNLHMHLTVNEKSCPICTKTSVEQHTGLFCASISLPMFYTTPHFMALIHRETSSDAEYLCSSGKDVHIIDCIHGQEEVDTLKLRFFAPMKFVVEGYQVTIAVSQRIEGKNTILTALPSTILNSMLAKFIKYDFSHVHQIQQSHPEANKHFGELKFHLCDGDEAESEISLSDSTVVMLCYNQLSIQKIFSDEIRLTCGTLQFTLKYRYPIDYDKVKVIWFKSLKKIKIHGPRAVYQFTEEQPVFIKKPDNQLSLPPQPVEDEVIVSHTSMQKTKGEKIFSDSCNRDHALMTPLMNVKESFTILFQCKEKFFQVNFPDNSNHALILVNQCLFDYQHKAPALDLAFHFTDVPDITKRVQRAWYTITKDENNRTILADDAEYDLLRKSLLYFSKRTSGTCQMANSPNEYQVLHKHNVQLYFKRAIIFPLYCDPDQKGFHMMGYGFDKLCEVMKNPNKTIDTSTPPCRDEKCDYCYNIQCTKKCTGCDKAQYCSKDCQTKHWPVHKKDCKMPTIARSSVSNLTSTSEEKLTCSYCSSSSSNLKKCTGCRIVQYCSKDCQSSHWLTHKADCKKPFDPAQSSVLSSVSLSSSQANSRVADPICAYCGTGALKLLTCGRCGETKYCGISCQRKDWKSHKLVCKKS